MCGHRAPAQVSSVDGLTNTMNTQAPHLGGASRRWQARGRRRSPLQFGIAHPHLKPFSSSVLLMCHHDVCDNPNAGGKKASAAAAAPFSGSAPSSSTLVVLCVAEVARVPRCSVAAHLQMWHPQFSSSIDASATWPQPFIHCDTSAGFV
jgi:hypothetical protein